MEKEKVANQDFLDKQLKRFPDAKIPENWEIMTRPDLFRILSTNNGRGKQHHEERPHKKGDGGYRGGRI